MRSLAAIMRKADAPPRARLRAIDILLLQPHQAGVPEQVRADVALLEWSQVDAVATSCYGLSFTQILFTCDQCPLSTNVLTGNSSA